MLGFRVHLAISFGQNGEREVSKPRRYGFEIVHARRPAWGQAGPFETNTPRINRKFTPNQTIQILDSDQTGDLSAPDMKEHDCDVQSQRMERFDEAAP